MTEKRFELGKSENQDTIFDNEGPDDYYHLGNDTRDVKALCKLLNELHEENQLNKLQEENQQLKKIIKENSKTINQSSEEKQQLKKENENLKQTIETQIFNYNNAKSIIHSSEKQIWRLEDKIEELKQFQEKVAEVIESKMEDNACNDYKMEVLKEIWNELKLDEVWFE